MLEMCFFGVGLEVTIPSVNVVFHEIWIAESLRTAWTIWSRLGWDESSGIRLHKANWRDFNAETEAEEVMNRIAHFSRVIQYEKFDFEQSFQRGWDHVIKTISLIERSNISLEPCEEVTAFRLEIARFLARGVKQGLTQQDPVFEESFIYSVKNHFSDTYFHELEVSFARSETETTVTVLSPRHNNDILKCDCPLIQLN